MDLGKAFLDMLSPDWYTEKDDPFAPVGDYQPFSTASQVGDTVFAYTLDADDTSHCRLSSDILQTASADNPRMYKVYGTITETKGSSCTLDSDSTEEIPLRVVDGELCLASQQELYEDMELEEQEVEPEIEETLNEEETVEESFISLFGLDDDTNDDVEDDDELTAEEESNLLRMWDGANSTKTSQYDKDKPLSFGQKNSNQSYNKSFSDKPFSRNQHNSWDNNYENQQNENHYEISENDNLVNSDFDTNYPEGMENTVDNIDTMPNDYTDSNSTGNDDNDSGKSEDAEIDIGM